MKNIFGNRNKGGTGNAVSKENTQANTGQAPERIPPAKEPEANKTPEVETEKKSLVAKKVDCNRCKGDGVWHSSCTGVRAETSSEPAIDPKRRCPKCKGSKVMTIYITHEQRNMEIRVDKAKKQATQAAANARAAADAAQKIAEEAEAKVYN